MVAGQEDYFLSIGQMIEFLEDNERYLTIEYTYIDTKHEVLGYRLFEDPTGKYENKELCDALWKAVKEALNA